MINIEYIKDNFEAAQQKLARKGFELSHDIIDLSSQRDTLIREIDGDRELYNQLSTKIRTSITDGVLSSREVEILKEEAREKRTLINEKENNRRDLESTFYGRLLTIPNFPADHVPDGKSDADNVVREKRGKKPEFDFIPKDHVDLGLAMDIFDFDRASKLSGARFVVLKGAGSVLQRSLVSFMLDLHSQQGYREVTVPYLVSRKTMTGTGQLPKFEFDLFKTEVDGKELFLIPTAEVPVTNLHSNETLLEEQLPIKYTCYSENFRAEAGSAGRDTRGILRQHQFPKVELVQLIKPENSWNELEKLRVDAEEVLRQLGLHYQVVSLCTGDLGFSTSYTYDLEVWIPGQNKYREISSCSNYEDFQARRMNTKFTRSESGKKEFVHTINGSGLAVGRSIIAILEQCQRKDGSVVIPEALHPYTKFKIIQPNGKLSY